ncbi:MAG: hypothetical protein D6812_09035 [Deltaproteobacteria bacterium]|nr:MAG: hypothetical protein D6812_09035 [Deltaproteobacteria bacterium]
MSLPEEKKATADVGKLNVDPFVEKAKDPPSLADAYTVRSDRKELEEKYRKPARSAQESPNDLIDDFDLDSFMNEVLMSPDADLNLTSLPRIEEVAISFDEEEEAALLDAEGSEQESRQEPAETEIERIFDNMVDEIIAADNDDIVVVQEADEKMASTQEKRFPSGILESTGEATSPLPGIEAIDLEEIPPDAGAAEGGSPPWASPADEIPTSGLWDEANTTLESAGSTEGEEEITQEGWRDLARIDPTEVAAQAPPLSEDAAFVIAESLKPSRLWSLAGKTLFFASPVLLTLLGLHLVTAMGSEHAVQLVLRLLRIF